MDCYARFMIHFLDELAVDRAHLVGHSHGGRVSIALAADEPERVGRLAPDRRGGDPAKRGWRYRRRVAVAKLGPAHREGRRRTGTAAAGADASAGGVA